MSGTGRFDDLLARLGSAAVMLAVGLAAIWAGGVWFATLLVIVVALMVWEVAHMIAPEDAQGGRIVAAVAATAMIAACLLPLGFALPLLMIPGFVGMARFDHSRRIFAVYSTMICIAGVGLYVLREQYGMIWMIWLACVVIATDVLGYFAGRVLGGPKFWPKVSPKKTWSGTIAGWVGAALVGAVFMPLTAAGPELIGISVALSMASQMGDISESAIKRRSGVKDSSALIPGHGGLLDRFDGMLAASVMLLLVEHIIDFPPVVQ